MTNIFEALRADHDIQRSLVKDLVATQGDSQERKELFEKLKQQLEAHAIYEERFFYVPLIKDELTQDKARHSIAEHKELDDLVEKLESYDFSASQWLQTAENLHHKLVHHLDEEEHEVFQLGGKVLTDQQKEHLATEYLQEMKKSLSQNQ